MNEAGRTAGALRQGLVLEGPLVSDLSKPCLITADSTGPDVFSWKEAPSLGSVALTLASSAPPFSTVQDCLLSPLWL